MRVWKTKSKKYSFYFSIFAAYFPYHFIMIKISCIFLKLRQFKVTAIFRIFICNTQYHLPAIPIRIKYNFPRRTTTLLTTRKLYAPALLFPATAFWRRGCIIWCGLVQQEGLPGEVRFGALTAVIRFVVCRKRVCHVCCQDLQSTFGCQEEA